MIRGDICELRVRGATGHEQQGKRYGIVVQSTAMLPRSPVIVVPTSRSARPASFRPEIEIENTTTRALVEQIGAVDGSRLGALVGHATPEEMWGVDEALCTVLALR